MFIVCCCFPVLCCPLTEMTPSTALSSPEWQDPNVFRLHPKMHELLYLFGDDKINIINFSINQYNQLINFIAIFQSHLSLLLSFDTTIVLCSYIEMLTMYGFVKIMNDSFVFLIVPFYNAMPPFIREIAFCLAMSHHPFVPHVACSVQLFIVALLPSSHRIGIVIFLK